MLSWIYLRQSARLIGTSGRLIRWGTSGWWSGARYFINAAIQIIGVVGPVTGKRYLR
ncbi:MAG TPA: hypothetical protein VH933_06960 [Aestuariivirgaceae bacterium]